MENGSYNTNANAQPINSAALPLTDLLDVNQTAKVLGISPKTLRDHVLHRRIDYVKLGGRVLFRQDTLWELIDHNTVRAQIQ